MTDPATAAKTAAAALRHRRIIARVLLGLAAFVALLITAFVLLMVMLVLAGIAESNAPDPVGGDAITGDGGIPALARVYVPLYNQAARAYGVSPFLLMAVHENETGYSTCDTGGCPKHHGTTNSATAAGAMQFITGTWPAYASSYQDGQRPADYPYEYAPHPDRWDDFDSIMAAGAYFKGLGAGPKLDARTYRALLSYKGTPPASIPYAQHDYQRALELQTAATTAGSLTGPLDGVQLGPIGPGGIAWPVNGPLTSPFCETRAWEQCHPGIDIGVAEGTPVHAAAAGRVVTMWPAPGGGYGNYICLRHSQELSTCYAHLSRSDVQMGEEVARGQTVGLSGCTGRCYGAHLHFEVRLGPGYPSPVTNPLRYLP